MYPVTTASVPKIEPELNLSFVVCLCNLWKFLSSIVLGLSLYSLRLFIFWNFFLKKSFFKLFYVCLLLEKLINKKHFLVKKILAWFRGKYFPRKSRRKTLYRSYEKFRNIILFIDYIKFGTQTFDCYIYILFWIFIFQFHLLKFNFYINSGSHFYNCYLFFPYYFFIGIFYVSNLVLILLIVTYFIWNNLLNVNYYYFNFFIFHFFLDLISIILIIIFFIW
jgi:hypothetical protein